MLESEEAYVKLMFNTADAEIGLAFFFFSGALMI